jgi:hypothetical protein
MELRPRSAQEEVERQFGAQEDVEQQAGASDVEPEGFQMGVA